MITKPTFLIDEEKCRNNIMRMSEKANRNGVIFRPHCKTHQSLEIASWLRDSGVDKITVSSLEMAEYFAEEWEDITVAFPVNILEIETINRLAGRINLNLLAESAAAAEFLKENLKYPVGIFLKIDVGYHRTGLQPKDFGKIDLILKVLGESDKLGFRGFLTHAGHTYHCRTKEEILRIHNRSIELLTPLKKRYVEQFPELIVSVGDTPSCSVAEDFSMFDEIRPGNFVFYDLSQQQIGSCTSDEISAAIACPIVAIHSDRSEIVIYGGGVHLSKERMDVADYGTIYGLVVDQKEHSWGDVIPGMFVKTLSQEHGIVSGPKDKISGYRIGDILFILPVHSCMTANLMDRYLTTGGRKIEKF